MSIQNSPLIEPLNTRKTLLGSEDKLKLDQVWVHGKKTNYGSKEVKLAYTRGLAP